MRYDIASFIRGKEILRGSEHRIVSNRRKQARLVVGNPVELGEQR